MVRTSVTMVATAWMLGLAACGGGKTPSAPTAEAGPAGDSKSTATSPELVRLYTLDCGRIEIKDFGFFTDSGKPTGKGRTLSDACFLVRHPKGTLLWDTGLSESIAKSKDGVANPIGAEFVDAPLTAQLAKLSLAPKDVTFLGISHLHADHAGNANLFTSATWLVSKREIEAGTKTPAPLGVDASHFSEYKNVKSKWLEADEDVFGDGSVRILQTPGHTPGHQSLFVKLAHAGAIVLSGDLAHSHDNWDHHVVPSFNDSRENTKASMDRVEAILRETHARFIVQHDPNDVATLPKFPEALD